MFRRRRREGDPAEPLDAEVDEFDAEVDELDEEVGADDDGGVAAGAGAARGAGPADPPAGPWDAEDLPAHAAEVSRVDLGGLLVPLRPDVEMRVDMTPEHQVVAVTLVSGQSALQLGAFAAPRSAGIWDEVREEIAESIRAGGGSAEEADGPFGRELRARVPGDVPGQGRVLQPARFVGVDGPRWFLRGLLSGPAATDPVQARPLEALLRDVVVVRGKDAMAPRDQIPLRLPKEVTEVEEEPPGGPDLGRLERGPEIAETR